MQLALVGSMASDDPEGWDFFNATVAHADGDPDIHILNNFNNVGAIEVNAFQSHADVRDPEVDARGLRADRLRGALEGRARSSAATSAASRCRSTTASAATSSRPVEDCAARTLEILDDPGLGKALGRSGQGARAHALPHATYCSATDLRIFRELRRAR